MIVVIDTNVLVVANGRLTHASGDCQIACIDLLQGLATGTESDDVAVDDADLILSEYKAYANHSGSPGTGDMFFKYLHDNMYSGKRVRRIAITPTNDETRGFEELPPNELDADDRKFLAVAVGVGGQVVNAVDSDWAEQHALTASLGINVIQLCPDEAGA